MMENFGVVEVLKTGLDSAPTGTVPTLSPSALASPVPGLNQPTELNDEHKVYWIAIVIGLLGALGTISVIGRLYYRRKTGAFGLDDYVLLAALVLYIAWSVMSVYVNLCAGVGKPLWEVTMPEFSTWLLGIVLSMWLYPVMTTIIRLSILLSYRRFFKTPASRTWTGWLGILHATIVVQLLYLLAFVIVPAFLSRPLHKAWDDPANRKLYVDDFYYFRSQMALYIISMVFDVILLVLPIQPTMKLKMPVWKRIFVLVLSTLGTTASIAAAVKLGLFVHEMGRYKDPASAGAEWVKYDMSTKIPPQFSDYGLTFWLSSQIESTIALWGASTSAIGKAIVQAFKAWCDRKKRACENSDAEGGRGSGRQPQGAAGPRFGGITVTFARHQSTHTIPSPGTVAGEGGDGMAFGGDGEAPFTGPTCTTTTTISASPRED